MAAAEKAKSMSDFWRGQKGKYQQLAPLGMWYAEMPTSSVSAERLFAVMRSFESSQRHRLTHSHVRAELMAKFNRSIVSRMERKMCEQLLLDSLGGLPDNNIDEVGDGAAAGAGGGSELAAGEGEMDGEEAGAGEGEMDGEEDGEEEGAGEGEMDG
jgi:hypothetical protein